jgi:hypothetical protein
MPAKKIELCGMISGVPLTGTPARLPCFSGNSPGAIAIKIVDNDAGQSENLPAWQPERGRK